MMDDELKGRHWMSYVTYDGPADVLNGQICVVSVVLDAGAHVSFSGVRMVVVGKVTEELSTISIQDWPDAPYFQRDFYSILVSYPNVPLEPNGPSYRTALARRKKANDQSKKLLESGAETPLPLCTVVLELLDTSNSNWSSVGLTLRHEGFSTHKPLRILYDRALLFVPGQRSTVSVLRLSSNHSFTGIAQLTMTGVMLRGPKGTPTHCVRILPLSTRRSLPSLPFQVIQSIAYHGFNGGDQGFRSSLLSFSLVCKAWFPVIDMFWGSLGTLAGNERPNASSVFRALRKKPEKAKLIKSFSPWDYRVDGDNKHYYHLSEVHLDVLTMVTSVKALSVSSIHQPLVEPFLKVISTLSSIERCVINNPTTLIAPAAAVFNGDSTEPPQGYYLDVSDILKILPHWKQLRVLHMNQHKCTGLKGLHNQPEPNTHPAHDSQIEELYLQNGDILGSQLLQFVSPSQPTLTRVELHGLHGLSSHELLSFFSQVSSTIRRIRLTRCTVSREAEDEEYVFDAVMHKMVSLHHAFIEGSNLASLLTVTGKPPDTVGGTHNLLYVELAAPCQIEVDKILEALQVTAWRTIRLAHPVFSDWDAEPRARIYDAARQRGIRIEFYHPAPGHHNLLVHP